MLPPIHKPTHFLLLLLLLKVKVLPVPNFDASSSPGHCHVIAASPKSYKTTILLKLRLRRASDVQCPRNHGKVRCPSLADVIATKIEVSQRCALSQHSNKGL
jgi:hypothetical protein